MHAHRFISWLAFDTPGASYHTYICTVRIIHTYILRIVIVIQLISLYHIHMYHKYHCTYAALYTMYMYIHNHYWEHGKGFTYFIYYWWKGLQVKGSNM